jgi:hypothetical protein
MYVCGLLLLSVDLLCQAAGAEQTSSSEEVMSELILEKTQRQLVFTFSPVFILFPSLSSGMYVLHVAVCSSRLVI